MIVLTYKWERFHPLLLSIIFVILSFFYVRNLDQSSLAILKDVLSATINFSAISVGFIATALTIFYALAEKQIVQGLQQIRRADGRSVYAHILQYMVNSITVSLILTFYCISAIAFTGTTTLYLQLMTLVFIFLLVYSMLTLHRVIRILANLLI